MRSLEEDFMKRDVFLIAIVVLVTNPTIVWSQELFSGSFQITNAQLARQFDNVSAAVSKSGTVYDLRGGKRLVVTGRIVGPVSLQLDWMLGDLTNPVNVVNDSTTQARHSQFAASYNNTRVAGILALNRFADLRMGFGQTKYQTDTTDLTVTKGAPAVQTIYSQRDQGWFVGGTARMRSRKLKAKFSITGDYHFAYERTDHLIVNNPLVKQIDQRQSVTPYGFDFDLTGVFGNWHGAGFIISLRGLNDATLNGGDFWTTSGTISNTRHPETLRVYRAVFLGLAWNYTKKSD